jgi:hypothetical protein
VKYWEIIADNLKKRGWSYLRLAVEMTPPVAAAKESFGPV